MTTNKVLTRNGVRAFVPDGLQAKEVKRSVSGVIYIKDLKLLDA